MIRTSVIPLQHSNIIRKRCLSFLTSLDLFQNMSAQGLFRILRGNLYNVSMLAYIYITNQTSADAELQFIMGSKDYGKILTWTNYRVIFYSRPFTFRSMGVSRQDIDHWSAIQSDDSVFSLRGQRTVGLPSDCV